MSTNRARKNTSIICYTQTIGPHIHKQSTVSIWPQPWFESWQLGCQCKLEHLFVLLKSETHGMCVLHTEQVGEVSMFGTQK